MKQDTKDVISNWGFIILLIVLLCINHKCNGQKPLPVNDTFTVKSGLQYGTNLFDNDIGLSMVVTSFKIKTTPYTPGKISAGAEWGSVRINPNGGITIFPAKDYVGPLPEISYYINSDPPVGNSRSAKVFVTIVSKPAVPDSLQILGWVMWKQGTLINCRYGNFYCAGEARMSIVNGSEMYWVLLYDDNRTFIAIPKEWWDRWLAK